MAGRVPTPLASGRDVAGEGCKREAPWTKMSKEVGGSQGEAGAEECSSEIRRELGGKFRTTPVGAIENLLRASSLKP